MSVSITARALLRHKQSLPRCCERPIRSFTNTRPASDVRSKLSLDKLANHAAVTKIVNSSKERARVLKTQLDSRLTDASERWNTYSGYTAVEALKEQIVQLEDSLQEARSALDVAKQSYVKSVAERSSSQKEINDLLSRKSMWSDADLHRYTELLRHEHQLLGSEQRGEATLEQATTHVQTAFDQLMKTVLLRYHEEQIWSDRVRGLSTWGSLLVAGLNAALFVMAILLVEPYKRRKLAQTFETRLIQGEAQSRALIVDTIAEFEQKLEQFAEAQTQKAPVTASSNESSPVSDASVVKTTPIVEIEEEGVGIIDNTPPTNSVAAPTNAAVDRRNEENLVFATTVGVVAGALLSTILSLCWN